MLLDYCGQEQCLTCGVKIIKVTFIVQQALQINFLPLGVAVGYLLEPQGIPPTPRVAIGPLCSPQTLGGSSHGTLSS